MVRKKILNYFPPSLSFKMAAILQHYQKVVSRDNKTMCAQQLIAVGSNWCQELESVVRNHMVKPCIVISMPEEAAIYGGVQQVSHMSR